MSWILYEPHYRKVIKSFDDPIEAAEYCSDIERLVKTIADLKTYLVTPVVHYPADLYLHNTDYNWSFQFVNDWWFEASSVGCRDWIEPELQHRMWQIISHQEPTDFVPFDQQPPMKPEDFPF